MGDQSKIGWTESTWNTIVGCSKVSEGCHNCYAETLALRYGWSQHPWAERFAAENVKLKPNKLLLPLTPKWASPRRVFVNSLADVFHPLVPFEYVDKMFAVMAMAPQHTFQILTKRPERMREYMTSEIETVGPVTMPARQRAVWLAARDLAPKDAEITAQWPLPNVWLGTSIENSRWTQRARILADTPAAVRFISAEPLIGSLFTDSRGAPLSLDGIDWVIVGGESGGGRRPFDMKWAREIRDACVEKGVAFFMKQVGAFRSGQHEMLTEEDGACWEWTQYPDDKQAPRLVHKAGSGCQFSKAEWERTHPVQQEVMAL